jgi:hypothetical protein
LALAAGGLSGIGDAAAGTGAACGGGGTGSGQIGSTAVIPEGAGGAAAAGSGLAAGFRARRDAGADCAFGLAAAAAAAPGTTGPVGSVFMMLTAGMEAADGKSILTGRCGGCPFDAAASTLFALESAR